MDNKILNKIKKCLALAKSSEPHEAAAAMRQAQKLMTKHGVSALDVELSDIGETCINLGIKNKPIEWLAGLVSTIKRAFGCEAIFGWDYDARTVQFIGAKSNVAVAEYCFTYLHRLLINQRKTFVKGLSNRYKSSNKTKLGDEYALGWVTAVYSQVGELAQPFQTFQLIRAYKDKKYTNLSTLNPREVKKHAHGDNANSQGYKDGSKVKLHAGVRGENQKQLGSA